MWLVKTCQKPNQTFSHFGTIGANFEKSVTILWTIRRLSFSSKMMHVFGKNLAQTNPKISKVAQTNVF